MRDAFTPEPAAAWLSARLQDAKDALAATWLERLVDLPAISVPDAIPSRDLLIHVPELLSELAEHLRRPETDSIGANKEAMGRAAQLGALRFEQRASVHQLLRDYQMLEDLLEDFVQGEVEHADPPLPADIVLRVMRRITSMVRVLQHQTIDTFISKYTATIERQNMQLLSFGRMVAREMRQPLAVLQLMSTVMPIRAGDIDTTHLIEVLDRNVKYLTGVAARLERLAHGTGLETDLTPNEQTVSLTALVDDAVKRLAGAAEARGVRCVVDGALPLLEVEPARTELVFLNLIANGIKHSDPAKTARVVEVRAVPGAQQPTVMVRDNGVGIPAARAKQIFRELGRPHGHRDRTPGNEGLGLGLAIVRKCMDACGGTVSLESVEGEGTTVTLTWRE